MEQFSPYSPNENLTTEQQEICLIIILFTHQFFFSIFLTICYATECHEIMVIDFCHLLPEEQNPQEYGQFFLIKVAYIWQQFGIAAFSGHASAQFASSMQPKIKLHDQKLFFHNLIVDLLHRKYRVCILRMQQTSDPVCFKRLMPIMTHQEWKAFIVQLFSPLNKNCNEGYFKREMSTKL